MQRPTVNVLGVFCHVISWPVLALLLTVPWGLVGCQQAWEPAGESGLFAVVFVVVWFIVSLILVVPWFLWIQDK